MGDVTVNVRIGTGFLLVAESEGDMVRVTIVAECDPDDVEVALGDFVTLDEWVLVLVLRRHPTFEKLVKRMIEEYASVRE